MSNHAIVSIDARSGAVRAHVGNPSNPVDVRQRALDAAAAMPWLSGLGRAGRAKLLTRLADAVETRRADIVALADLETALGLDRLNGELTRTCFQLRFLAEAVREGSYLGATIDHAADTAMGPRPDLRRTAVPLGPVAVFGASNFPLAFSAPGGDTASALAAGCPVIVKAHDSHAATCALIGEVFAGALAGMGAPAGVFQLVYGFDAGAALVTDERIAAVGFTGSVAGGRSLADLAARRAVPIPFYGELGSVNPLVVTEAAARERAAAIGAGLATSMCLGLGQFCTKPGLFLVPAAPAGEAVVASMVDTLATVEAGYLLNDGISQAFAAGVQDVDAVAHVRYRGQADGRRTAPALYEAPLDAVFGGQSPVLLEEHFGPFGLVVRYRSRDDLVSALAALPPALTGTVHLGTDDPDAEVVTRELAQRSGRIVYNGYPTGVAVAWAMHHGGPYPASTASASTSVGAAAIGRWLRPLTYQDAPDELLPDELKNESEQPVPRRVDGQLTLPSSKSSPLPSPSRKVS